jgi:hypothetical protein
MIRNEKRPSILYSFSPSRQVAKSQRRKETQRAYPAWLIPPVAWQMILVSNQNVCGRRPMETFAKLFERFLVFVYHCFDRIVIQGYLPLLTRSEHIVYFFREVHGIYPITPQVLAKRTPQYRAWVESYARNHKIPIQSPEKGQSKENFVRPYLQCLECRGHHGVYFIVPTMEMGSTFCSLPPKYPTDDPNYRIIRRRWSRYLHYYFYIRDPVIGPFVMCVGTYLRLNR